MSEAKSSVEMLKQRIAALETERAKLHREKLDLLAVIAQLQNERFAHAEAGRQEPPR